MNARAILASCSVAVVAIVVSTATVLGPERGSVWLVLCSLVAIAAALQSAALESSDLTTALLFSLPPVTALVTDGSPTWLIGPLAALLLLAAELNALSWQAERAGSATVLLRRRLLHSGQLVVLGLVAAVVVGMLASGLQAGGAAAVVAAAVAISALGFVVFRAGT